MQIFRDYLVGLWKETWELNRQFLISLLDPGTDTLLDCGCAEGALTECMARSVMSRRVVGIEIDRDQASTAAARGIDIIIGDLNEKFELEDNITNAVVANQVIEHLYNIDSFLSEGWRVLKPGGVFIISTENLAS